MSDLRMVKGMIKAAKQQASERAPQQATQAQADAASEPEQPDVHSPRWVPCASLNATMTPYTDVLHCPPGDPASMQILRTEPTKAISRKYFTETWTC
jgi:hypothetical protein